MVHNMYQPSLTQEGFSGQMPVESGLELGQSENRGICSNNKMCRARIMTGQELFSLWYCRTSARVANGTCRMHPYGEIFYSITV